MAFDLNKGENPPKKSFDLNKSGQPAGSSGGGKQNKEGAPKSNRLWLLLAGIVILAGGAWYARSRGATSQVSDRETGVDSTTTGTTSVAGAVQPAGAQDSTAGTNSTTGASAAVGGDATANSAPAATAQTEKTSLGASGVPPTVSTRTTSTGTPVAAGKEKGAQPAVTAGNGAGGTSSTSEPQAAATSSKSAASVDGAVAGFASGSSNPRGIALKSVNAIVARLANDPHTTVAVDGYASSEGPLDVNQRLSLARANAFKSLLMKKGVAESRITSTGRGIDNPIGSNDTPEGRAKNRRVEVAVK